MVHSTAGTWFLGYSTVNIPSEASQHAADDDKKDAPDHCRCPCQWDALDRPLPEGSNNEATNEHHKVLAGSREDHPGR